MDIIQQKLIWLMSSGIALLLLFKLNLHRAGMGDSILLRLKIGFILILSGSLLGLATTVGIFTSSIPDLWQLRFIESVAGYLFGWFFIISGTFAWARCYFDRKGRPLMAINARILSDKISKSLIRSHRPNQMLDAVGEDILDILSCRAVSLHRIAEDKDLRLTYALGLTTRSRRLVELPVDNRHMFKRAQLTGQAVISDKDLVFGDGTRLESLSGPLTSAISLPVRSEGVTNGIITLYRTHGARFSEDDANLMEIVCDGMGISLANEIDAKKEIMDSRYREMVTLAIKPFENKESLTSALIKSAKIIHGYIPFGKLTLFIHGNGVPLVFDYNLSTGGLVSIATGYFPRQKYPELYGEFNRDAAGDDGRPGSKGIRNRKCYVMAIFDDQSMAAHIRIDLPISKGKFPYLPYLGEALGGKIAEQLKYERVAALEDKAAQWLGALRYYQEKSLSVENSSEFLGEIASLVVDITPAAFCRILISDDRGKLLKTAALAQARNLIWKTDVRSRAKLPSATGHQKALRTNDAVYFTISGPGKPALDREEIRRLIPDGTSHGVIIPFQMGRKTVGLLTAGEFRNPARAPVEGTTSLFLSSLAGVISMFLTRHMDRRAGISKEGKRFLTLKKREREASRQETVVGPGIRSRVNGPLAGIMASCEYIQSQGSSQADVARFIEVIQRNAVKIRDITAGLGKRDLIPTE